MHSGPVAYATLMDEAIGPNLRHIEEEVPKRLADTAESLVFNLRMEIQTAYQQGLVHGFQQGVEAESKRADRNELQEAVDRAYSAMLGAQYVGGPSEREAWQDAMAALAPVHTQHVGQGEAVPSSEDQA